MIKGANDEGIKDRWGGRVLEAIRDYKEQEIDLYKKMLQEPKPAAKVASSKVHVPETNETATEDQTSEK